MVPRQLQLQPRSPSYSRQHHHANYQAITYDQIVSSTAAREQQRATYPYSVSFHHINTYETGSEADDERSSISTLTSRRVADMGPNGDFDEDHPDPTYPGEDTRPTSNRELLGFYTYSFAAEVFVICGLGAFIPITLEDLARASPSAVLAKDHSTPCRAHGVQRSLSTATAILFDRADHESRKGAQCVFNILGVEVNTASFAMYTFSLSVFVQALLVVTMSGAADHGRYRKSLLLSFAVIGAVATMLFLPVTPNVYILGSLWAIIGNVCFGASFVLLNSFLPLLVRWHPASKPQSLARQGFEDDARGVYHEVRSIIFTSLTAGFCLAHLFTARSMQYELAICNKSIPPKLTIHHPSETLVTCTDGDLQDETEEHFHRESVDPATSQLVDSTASLLPGDRETTQYPPSRAAPSAEMQLSTKFSSYGIGIGYLAAVIVQVLAIFILKATGGTLFSLRLVLFVIGSWWLVFTIPASFLLRSRPGPPLAAGKTRTWLGYVTYSWKNLGKTILRARRLKDVLLFLAAWFMISDAIATVSGTAILFAKTTLGMDSASLALINVIVTICGIAGALSWSKVSRLMQLKPSQTILACICLFELIPLYGLLGYIPAIQRWGVVGLQQPWEMYPLAAVYGLVLGGLSSYCRSLFGELIPPGSEAAFYALYAITDKGSSVFGPAIVGAITDATGDIRPAFWFLAVLIGLPIPIMFAVNVDRGKREGVRLAKDTAPEEFDVVGPDPISNEGLQHDTRLSTEDDVPRAP